MKNSEWELDFTQSIILIIDDNKNNLGVLIGYLEELGFGIVSAINGELGLRRAKLIKPNLILLDVMMPGWDGFETCRRLKADEETREIPVIFMTALNDPEDKVKAFAVGAVDYINKPLHQEEVAARVITHLRLRGLTQSLQQQAIELEKKSAEATKEKRIAEAANQAKSDFLSKMSHELRTPLNGILGYADILKRRLSQDKDTVEGLNIIESSGQHLLTLINDLLDLAKIEAGKMELFPDDLYLPTFLENMTSIIHSRAEEKNLNFILERQQSLPQGIETDETRLRQVLLNLLGNAIKFTESGQVTLKISLLGLDPAQDDEPRQINLRFEIQDTGVGMQPEELQTIFKPYEQVGQGKRRSEGTGLGLAITQQLVKLMGGDLQANSQPGQGSCFWFEVSFPEVESFKMESEAEQALISGYEGDQRKILLVDDRPENRWVLQSMLEPLGFALQTAKNGQEALQQIQQFAPDLILMDLMMPIMDGFAATQAIRAAPDITQPRIVVVSAEAFQAERQRAKAAGSDDYLVKPVDKTQLFRALQKQLALAWVYEGTPTSEEPEQAWLLPPPSKLQALYNIALGGYMSEIHTQADHILSLDPQYKPFVDKLHALADEFDDEAIMALLEPHLLEEM